jgi:hypothetical protein
MFNMKSLHKKILFLLLSLVAICGCKKPGNISEKQVILFQFDYLNYAWGYQHNGFIIDNEGNVLKYNNPEDWNFPDKDLILTEKQVAENIAKCTLTGVRISEDELKKYSSYIKNISLSKVSAIKNAGADAGSSEYVCYQFSENSSMYRGYLIKMEGDFTCENLNFYSKKVVTWLKNINTSLIAN